MPDPELDTASTLRTPHWYRTATRWTQLTLTENDPVKFDPQFWIDLFKRSRSNATCLSAGGYMAFYPSKVPLHYVSKYLGDTDPFGALVEGARNLDMHVMARVDPHAIHQDAADAHPEWVAIDRNGNPRRHWAMPELWVTCAYGDYNFRFMPQIVAEIARNYDIDAIFANRWQGHGVCYCESCRKSFYDAYGHDLPTSSDADDPAWKDWIFWRRDVLTRMIVEWDEVVKAERPHASFIPNMGGASLMEFDLALIEKHCPFIVIDHQGRRGIEPLWLAGRNGKRIRATFPERPVALITSIGPEEEYRWKDSVTTGAEIRSWVGNGVVHGMLPWFTKFNGVVPDERWIQPIVESFNWHATVEGWLARTAPTAEIAVIDPSTTLKLWAPEQRHAAEKDEMGFYHALVEARLPFEFLSDERLTAEQLDRFKLVILANATCLSDGQCAALQAYVERGGSLVAAFETSTLDERGNPRADFGLADVFGASRTGPTTGLTKNKYIALDGSHPVNDGFEGAERIIGGTRSLPIRVTGDATAPFRAIPDFPDLPMEEVYAREAPRDPAVIVRQFEKGGRVVYFPWNIGAVFWEVLTPDHQRLIANAVTWALNGRPEVEVSGKGMLDISVRKAGDATVIGLFNLTNPMMLKGPVRETMSCGPQTISVAAPKGRTAGSAWLAVADRPVPVTMADGRAIVEVPDIDYLEMIRFSWN